MDFSMIISSLVSGTLGSMGFGGGTVLIIYLAVFSQIEQTKAQGINLIFFIPCAIYSVIIYSKSHLIKSKYIRKMLIFCIIGLGIGYYLLNHIPTELLGKLFGAFLILLSLKDIIPTFKKGFSSLKR